MTVRLFNVFVVLVFLSLNLNVFSQPDIVKVSVSSDDSLLIEWEDLPGVDSFTIIPRDYIGEPATTNIKNVAAGETTTKIYEDPVVRGNRYYWVGFYSGGLQSGESTVPFKSINLSGEVDPCALTVDLTWNSNYGWNNPEYYIVDKFDNILDTINGDTKASLNLISGTDYELHIEAKGPNGEIAKSYPYIFNSGGTSVPSYINLTATIEDEKNVHIYADIDSDTDVTNYKIVRSRTIGGFDTIANLKGITDGKIDYIDNEIDASNYTFKYLIVAVNQCGVIVASSSYTNTIDLNLDSKDNFISVNWNRYEPSDTTDIRYTLQRIDNNGEIMTLVNNYDKSNYIDTLNQSIYQPGDYLDSRLCYKVIANEPTPGNTGISEVVSNIKCEVLIPSVSTPNAFTPNGDGLNDEFLPYFDFRPKEYLLLIYNKWGNLVFESSVPEEGWKGNIQGSMAEEGVYAYSLKITTFDDKVLYKEGAVAVVYP